MLKCYRTRLPSKMATATRLMRTELRSFTKRHPHYRETLQFDSFSGSISNACTIYPTNHKKSNRTAVSWDGNSTGAVKNPSLSSAIHRQHVPAHYCTQMIEIIAHTITSASRLHGLAILKHLLKEDQSKFNSILSSLIRIKTPQ